MAAKNDEHVHHPICEACGKQFADTNQLSTHIDEQHRKKVIHDIIARVDLHTIFFNCLVVFLNIMVIITSMSCFSINIRSLFNYRI